MSKRLLIDRATTAGFDTGPVGAPREAYEFGAVLSAASGPATAVAVVEKTDDGGATWAPVITFEMDTAGECAVPAGAPVSFDALVIRARVTSIAGNGASISVWMR